MNVSTCPSLVRTTDVYRRDSEDMIKRLVPSWLVGLCFLQLSCVMSIAASSPSLTVDFGSRSGTQVAIPSRMLGAQYIESLPDTASRSMVSAAGLKTSRLHANVQGVYATPTPAWNKIDSQIRNLKVLGLHAIVEIDSTPPWLQPAHSACANAPTTSVPKDLNRWGQMAASFVAHFDQTFPGVVLDYEIWNEPNTATLCSSNRLNDYLDIYAAAAPLMKAQARADGATIHIGGPASAGLAFTSLLTDPRTAPYVDFYSYHLYVATPTQVHQGMTWDGSGGTPSLLKLTLNAGSGEQATYLRAVSAVRSGKTPLGARTPIYFDEFNDNWAFLQDCCRNSSTYSPLFNSLTVASILNSVYAGASQVPTKMVYYAAVNTPFCLLGIANAAMDCAKASASSAAPYPQLYTYKLIAAPTYLDLVDGGHMATSVTLSAAAQAQGLVATAFYTSSQNSILIINPTAVSFAGVTVQMNNIGLATPKSALYTLNSSHTTISSDSAVLVPVAGGAETTVNLPPYTVMAITLK